MDTNRFGNLKRFFSISDNDRVWNLPAELWEDMSQERPAEETYDYIFWDREAVIPNPKESITLKGLFDRLSKDGKLVVYFDNPYSIHNFSRGTLQFQAVSALSYPLFSQEIKAFCQETEAFARWYYPYPNVSFPCMFFTDEHLPAGGECDDNYYHFDAPAMEVFKEREAVDALTAGGMYPYLAHAYMVVLSKEPLSDMPIYTRFSNERRADKQIRTDLMKDCVKKTAVSKEAAAHIKQMTGYEKKLGEILGGLCILGKPCEINRITKVEEEKRSVSFAYAGGESLESILDGMLAEGRDEEVADILLDICKQLRSIDGLAPFAVTDGFVDIFGKLPEAQQAEKNHETEWMSLPVTDIDMVCQNILVSDRAVVIDYEWTFDFPVPLDYLIFRFLYFYLEAKLRTCMERKAFADIYEKAGIREEDKEIFLAMETHFQRYVQQGAAVLRNEFDAHGAPLISKEELDRLLAERNEQCAYVVYENGDKLSVRGKKEKRGVFAFRIPAGQAEPGKKIRFYFTAAGVARIGAMAEKDGRMQGLSFETNGMPLGGLLYLFEEESMEIILDSFPGAGGNSNENGSHDQNILLSIEEVNMTRAARQELVKTISDLRFVADNREQQLQDIKNSASWKVTRPLRRLKGNKEE